MNTLYRQGVNTMMDSFVKLSQQQTMPQPETVSPKKQQTFTSTEAARIANIKGKNTIIKYLNDGTIKGEKHPTSGRWMIKRKALADYVGSDDF